MTAPTTAALPGIADPDPSAFPSEQPAPAAEPTPWYQPNGADLVFLVAALVIIPLSAHGMLDDPGLGWHLRNIDAIRAEGRWLTVDSFTEPLGDPPRTWLSNQWLGELVLWLGYHWAGLEGVAVVCALVLALMLRCLYRMLLADGLSWPVAAFWTALAAKGTACSWVARPNLFTLLFVLLTFRVCEQFHQGRLTRRSTLWLLPLFAIWANVHGGFVAGLILLAAALGLEAAQGLLALSPEQREAARGRAGHLGLLLGGVFLATLVNPYGLGLYRWVCQLLGDPYFMDLHQEWRSPDFHGKGALRFEQLMLLFPLLLGATRRRPNLMELGLAVLWLHFALNGFRYVALWALIATPLLARSTLEVHWLREQARRLKLSEGGSGLFAVRPASGSWLWTAVAALVLLVGARGVEGRVACHRPDILPTAALDRVLELHAQRRAAGRHPVIFHSYAWGGYLTWHGWPDCRNWIDDRNEVQGKEHIQDYFAIVETQPGWQEKLDRDGVELVCIQPDAPLTYRLAESPRWKEVYRDDYAVIFERPSLSRR
jgi:hypothetical protein